MTKTAAVILWGPTLLAFGTILVSLVLISILGGFLRQLIVKG